MDGKTASLLTEVIYENRLRPFTVSTGLNYSAKYTKNDYLGDASSLTRTNNNRLYAFAEIKGMLGQLRYALGSGASYIHYTQNDIGTTSGLSVPRCRWRTTSPMACS